MQDRKLLSPDAIRAEFSAALSSMYRKEVPKYGLLMDLVADINAEVLQDQPSLRAALLANESLARLDQERHGAIRLGTEEELAVVCRMFAVMGMEPVGYYDLGPAGVPVHSTAFRPISTSALAANPFRMFTSLLRLPLVEDPTLRDEAAAILARRRIFTPKALELLALAETQGGLDAEQAADFVPALIETFRWHGDATVDSETYARLLAAHRLVADVVCFRGPHLNHLTPRILDIDAAQVEMPRRGVDAKSLIEGPPRRHHPILLRQTSFKALDESIVFAGTSAVTGAHTARFGEIEQRGVALTRAGRALYDRLLEQARSGDEAVSYLDRLTRAFEAFPDDLDAMRREGLAFFRYRIAESAEKTQDVAHLSIEALLERGIVRADPIVYEDFLPVSAAGIFRSNLGDTIGSSYALQGSRVEFERALGREVVDEIRLYEEAEARSIAEIRVALSPTVPA
ncbi:VOC family protein [Variovorax paradoxus]|uniref:2-oxoadipate dioxygenase/decarboxylase HglS n=1 Tax=Variovorax paradoxus TaxID=34073 RepID=UPI001931E234|nr:VOC family protein [Variovorax paradoxus]